MFMTGVLCTVCGAQVYLIQNTRSLFYGRHYSSLHRLMSLHGKLNVKIFLMFIVAENTGSVNIKKNERTAILNFLCSTCKMTIFQFLNMIITAKSFPKEYCKKITQWENAIADAYLHKQRQSKVNLVPQWAVKTNQR